MSNDDLSKVQANLDGLGLRDVKFFFSNLDTKSNSTVRDEIAYVLSTHLRGDSVRLNDHPLGDAQLV